MKDTAIKMAYKISVEVDFFSQNVEVEIFQFADGNCMVIGTHVVPCPTKMATSLEDAKKIANTIYYDNIDEAYDFLKEHLNKWSFDNIKDDIG
jgi:hypothetical protein